MRYKFRGVPLRRNSPNAVNEMTDCSYVSESVPAPKKRLHLRSLLADMENVHSLTHISDLPEGKHENTHEGRFDTRRSYTLQ